MPRKVTPTYVLLNQITLAANSVEVVFSGLPQNYSDLVLVGNWQNSSTSSAGRLQLNGDTGANYSGVWMVGTGSSTGAGSEGSQTSARIAGASVGPDNAYTNVVTLQFLDYSAIDKHKTVLSRYGSAIRETQATASRWASTNAITSIRFFDILGQTFQSGATFSLYGIVA
jgi:hypothetical protein